MTTTTKTKTKLPETMRQARTWQSQRNHYADLGLCDRCAAQAAYGHQLGFTKVKGPCWRCYAIIQTFPDKKAGEWRALSFERTDSPFPDLPDTATPAPTTRETHLRQRIEDGQLYEGALASMPDGARVRVCVGSRRFLATKVGGVFQTEYGKRLNAQEMNRNAWERVAPDVALTA